MFLTETVDAEAILEENVQKTILQALDVKSWIGNIGTSALDFLIQVALCILIYYIISKILNKILGWMDIWMEKRGTAQTAAHFLRSLTKTLVLGFTIITMIVQLDIVDAASIAALIASAGVGVSLAAQGLLSNFAGGILLLTLKPFKEGDFITVRDADISGTVIKIELYYTTILTPTRERLAVPNSTLTDQAVSNSGLPSGLKRLSVTVGIAYSADLKKALSVLDELMEEDPRIKKENRRTYVEELGDSSIVIGLRCLVDADAYMDVDWDMKEKIRLRFIEEEIEIPFNQMDVHIKDISFGEGKNREMPRKAAIEENNREDNK